MGNKPVVAILGVGLIGGSLGMALKKKRWASKVIGLGRDQAKLRLALKLGACDEVSTDYSRVKNADIVVIATPVQTMEPLCRKLAPFLKINSVVTDCGSAKELPVRDAEKNMPGTSSFVGAHPMAGSEKTGVRQARADLFEKSICAITETKHTKSASKVLISTMWKTAGAKLIYLSPKEHDKIVALTSHFPHLVAGMIVATYSNGRKKDSRAEDFVATGFKSATRIASGDPVMWRDILVANRGNVLALLDDFESEIKSWKKLLSLGQNNLIEKKLRKIKDAREALN